MYDNISNKGETKMEFIICSAAALVVFQVFMIIFEESKK
jgi:hypothetical protein